MPTSYAASRLLLWLPVPAVVTMAYLLVRGHLALAAGVDDLAPVYGLGDLAIASVAVLGAPDRSSTRCSTRSRRPRRVPG